MKKFGITFLITLVVFFILGGIFGTYVFLPEFASWHEAFPDAVRETPDFVSGFMVGILQLVACIVLFDRLAINNLTNGAIVGIIYSTGIWLMVDLQMLSTTNIISYNYVALDALLSALMGAIIGVVITWSLKRFA
jgi:hypothetical protein|tara:strand:- start:3014 stop:3418 length:405 start_codon:yes stop_codon:yes gene_type:complete